MALGGSGGALAGHMVQEWDDGRHHETGVAFRHGTLGDRRKGEGTHMMRGHQSHADATSRMNSLRVWAR